MNILISNANDKPIYEQIYTQIRNQILSGALPPGQALPSIRALAKDLRVSVITTMTDAEIENAVASEISSAIRRELAFHLRNLRDERRRELGVEM